MFKRDLLKHADRVLKDVGGLAKLLELLAKDLSFSTRLLKFLKEDPVFNDAMNAYSAAFLAALYATQFDSYDKEKITPSNFSDETFEPNGYRLELRELPPIAQRFHGVLVRKIVRGWVDDSVLGGATLGDGLYFARQVSLGRQTLPSPAPSVVCPGSRVKDSDCLFRMSFSDQRTMQVKHGHPGDYVLLRISAP